MHKHGRSTRIQARRWSVQQMLKQSAKPAGAQREEQFDFVYCAGLFDYLPDPVCRSLLRHFHESLSPGGLLLVTNVDVHSSRHEMEYFLDWHLMYRDTQSMMSLIPGRIGPDQISLLREPAGINVFLEIRKPENG